MRLNEAETLLEIHLKENGFVYEREIKLVKDRRWRWDFLTENLAIEIQGGLFIKGRHSRGVAYTKDCEKMRAAAMDGYVPIYFTTADVLNGTAIQWLKDYKAEKG